MDAPNASKLKSARILVVEDEQDIRDLIVLHLTRAGYHVETAADGTEAIQKFTTLGSQLDLLILDWMIPEPNGIQLVQMFRAKGANTPVMMVTARSQAEDLVQGLESGADDFVTKPFDAKVLLARVAALLRRKEILSKAAGPSTSQTRTIGGIEIDPAAVQAKCQGQLLHLTLSEFKLLDALMQAVGKVLTREQLIAMVQGEGIAVVDRVVDTHVFGLRKKLGPCGIHIETVRGVGYRIQP
jgi:two-component system phosphate regulon response regulator PhoB